MMAVCGNTLWLLGGVVEVGSLFCDLLRQILLLEAHMRRLGCQYHAATAKSYMLQSSGR